MNPHFVIADDKHRAAPGSIRSPQFRRMIGLVWPHRRFIVRGIFAGVGYAVFSAVSVAALVPVLKVLLSEEGLHGWVDRTSAEARLGAELDVYRPADDAAEAPADLSAVVIQRIRGEPLRRAEVPALSLIHTVAGRQLAPRECFRRIAEWDADEAVRIGITSIANAAGQPVERAVELRALGIHWRAGRWAASLVPRAVTPEARYRGLLYVLAAVAVAVLISNAFRFIAEYSISLGTFRAMMDLRRALYRKVLRLPMSFFAHNISDLVSRFVQDVQEIQRGVLALFGRMFREPVRAVALFGLAISMNWRLTLVTLAIAPWAILLFWFVGRSIRRSNQRLLLGYGMMIGALEATLTAMSTIKAFTSENAERKRLWRIDRKMFTEQIRIAALQAFLRPMLEVIGVIAIVVVAAWLGGQVIDGEIKLDQFGALVFVFVMMFQPLRTVGDLYARVQRAAAGAQRIFSVLDSPVEEEVLAGAAPLAPLRDSIEFRDLVFTYPGAATPAINCANLTVRRGEIVAIAGPNGSGKTTLMNLLLRFYDPQQGQILFDGSDIREVTLQSLREQISLVTQDAVVFAVSMADNIAYGAPDATEQRIIDAARRAYADDFIRALPGGYDTVSGDRGSTLSGGQRQRLSIARAILRDAPILIFDEATSQIDAESEMRIQTALREFSSGRTTFVIAHRLSTLKFAHRIVVLNEGQVVDTGTHEQLLARCPLYQMLCRTQLVE
ncbi:MAG: ABC transporter ATP-binding protein [Phycisphaerales bacterium]|nr:MAG: ABC transporter ATP-binding protein [Phycisphaerales bacterium]